MSHAALALREAWESTLDDMRITGGSTLIGGPLADRIGEAVPIAIADEVASLVVLGEGPPLADDATVASTGLPDDSMTSVFMLAAWDHPNSIPTVVAEARRVVRAGGTVWLGRRNVDAMIHSTPSTLRASTLYRRHAAAVREALASESVAPTELALVRGRFDAIESWDYDLPVGAFSDAASYRAAVDSGMWLGIDLVEDVERSGILAALDTELADADYPIVEYQPWTLARGIKP